MSVNIERGSERAAVSKISRSSSTGRSRAWDSNLVAPIQIPVKPERGAGAADGWRDSRDKGGEEGERIVRFRDGQEKKMNTVDVRWQSFRIYSEKIGD
jgi:hypothetical protein